MRSKNIWLVSLLAFIASGTTAIAASTNPWAMPQPQGPLQGQVQGQVQGQMQGQGQVQGQPQSNMQGGFNMGGGFTFGGGSQGGQRAQPVQPVPQFVAPQPRLPQQVVPQIRQQQFGVYPPLSNDNTASSLSSPPVQPHTRSAPQPMPLYRPMQPYPYGQQNFGFNPGMFGFPGFGGFNNFGFGFGSGFNGGFGNGFNGMGGGFIAPGPIYPGYGSNYYQNYRAPQYQVSPKGK